MFADPSENVTQLSLSPAMVVADFGAGSGAYSLSLAKAVPAGKVYAIEVQKALLAKLEVEARAQHLTNVSVIWGDVERAHGSTLADQLVDVVLVSNLLFQITAKYALCLEAKRVLKPAGRLVIIDWQESFNNLGPAATAVVTAAEAEKIAGQAGFRLQSTFSAGAHHYGLIFTKA